MQISEKYYTRVDPDEKAGFVARLFCCATPCYHRLRANRNAPLVAKAEIRAALVLKTTPARSLCVSRAGHHCKRAEFPTRPFYFAGKQKSRSGNKTSRMEDCHVPTCPPLGQLYVRHCYVREIAITEPKWRYWT